MRSLPGTQLKRRSAVSFSEDTKNPEEPLGRQQQPGFFGLQLAAQGLQLAAEVRILQYKHNTRQLVGPALSTSSRPLIACN